MRPVNANNSRTPVVDRLRSRIATQADEARAVRNEIRLAAVQAATETRDFYLAAMNEVLPEKILSLLTTAEEKNEEKIRLLRSLPSRDESENGSLTLGIESGARIKEQIRLIRGDRLLEQRHAVLAMVDSAQDEKKSRLFTLDETAQLNAFLKDSQESIELNKALHGLYSTLLDESPYCRFISATERKEHTVNRKLATERQMNIALLMQYVTVETTLQQRLRALSSSPVSLAETLSVLWAGQYERRFNMLLGTLNGMINSEDGSFMLDGGKKTPVIKSLIRQFDNLRLDGEWIVRVGKEDGISEDIIDDIRTLIRSAEVLKENAEFFLKSADTKIETKADNSFLPQELLQAQAGKRPTKKSEKKTNESVQGKSQERLADGTSLLIDTELDGQLLGRKKGELVEVKNFRGRTASYSCQQGLWVRQDLEEGAGATESAEDLISTESKSDPRILEQAALQSLRNRQEQLMKKAEQLVQHAQRYDSLMQYMERHDAPFLQIRSTAMLACKDLSSAMKLARLSANAWERNGERFPALKKQCRHNMRLLNERANAIEADMQRKQHAWVEHVKAQMSSGEKLDGERLEFLHDKGQITRIEQTISRKKLAGMKVQPRKAVPDDYLDEHQIHLKGQNSPLTLHTHYRSKDAVLEQHESSHLQHANEDGTTANGPEISSRLLRKIHGQQLAIEWNITRS